MSERRFYNGAARAVLPFNPPSLPSATAAGFFPVSDCFAGNSPAMASIRLDAIWLMIVSNDELIAIVDTGNGYIFNVRQTPKLHRASCASNRPKHAFAIWYDKLHFNTLDEARDWTNRAIREMAQGLDELRHLRAWPKPSESS